MRLIDCLLEVTVALTVGGCVSLTSAVIPTTLFLGIDHLHRALVSTCTVPERTYVPPGSCLTTASQLLFPSDSHM